MRRGPPGRQAGRMPGRPESESPSRHTGAAPARRDGETTRMARALRGRRRTGRLRPAADTRHGAGPTRPCREGSHGTAPREDSERPGAPFKFAGSAPARRRRGASPGPAVRPGPSTQGGEALLTASEEALLTPQGRPQAGALLKPPRGPEPAREGFQAGPARTIPLAAAARADAPRRAGEPGAAERPGAAAAFGRASLGEGAGHCAVTAQSLRSHSAVTAR